MPKTPQRQGDKPGSGPKSLECFRGLRMMRLWAEWSAKTQTQGEQMSQAIFSNPDAVGVGRRIESERWITMTDAAKWIAQRTGGKKTHVSTIHRWATRGCRGRRLESVLIGPDRFTSVEALLRFSNPDQTPETETEANARIRRETARDELAAVRLAERLGVTPSPKRGRPRKNAK